VADLLLHPGETVRFNGATLTYPDTRLVYWAGGNPFHHHQDLNRLRRAFARVDTLVVHEIAWTATARHADILLPCTMTLERQDIGSNSNDPLLVAMHQITEPWGEARDDYDIFAALAARLGAEAEAAFTEGRTTRQWLEHLYESTRLGLVKQGLPAPSFDEFWTAGEMVLPQRPDDGDCLRRFRSDPVAHKLTTPTGKIEIFSATIDSFNEPDCPGHPVWLPTSIIPSAAAPLCLVANQPATRLHSQLDFGGHSAASKHRGREVAQMHPHDAAARGIEDGGIIRLFNTRGACLAAVRATEDIRAGVIQLPTGAWYDPADPEDDMSPCVHGNPNVLTRDIGTSNLAQGCTGQLTMVEVERFEGNLPPIQAYDPPATAKP
jgi:biotin/methionine sulfoxide reductase